MHTESAWPAREAAIRLWFTMWLKGEDLGIARIFAPEAVYVESWGPAYQGIQKIKHWFDEWNTRGTVLTWDIRQYLHQGRQTAVEWYFRCAMDDGRVQAFDGVSLVRWTAEGKIAFLKEFGCSCDTYDPYENGPVPHFRTEDAAWF